MRTWLALLVAPTLALACQALLFAQVTPSCAAQHTLGLQLTAGVCLLLALVFTLLAHGAWRDAEPQAVDGPDSDAPSPATRRRFLACAATAVGAVSSLVILMMWSAAWVLSPCAQ